MGTNTVGRCVARRGDVSFACGRGGRAAFTLVELLVVIGIIGVLISILIPTLGRARESASRAACMSNQRQIGMAVLMYEQANKVLPGPVLPAIFDPDIVETGPLSAAYKARQWTTDDVLQRYVGKSKKVWFCPASEELRYTATPVGSTSPYAGKVLGYSYKIGNLSGTSPKFFFGSHSGLSANITAADQKPKKLSQVRSDIRDPSNAANEAPARKPLSEIWFLTDLDGRNFTTGASADFGICDTAVPAAQRRPAPVHKSGKQGRIYTFLDGHSEYRTIDFWPVNN